MDIEFYRRHAVTLRGELIARSLSVTFREVGPGGQDLYDVVFANGAVMWSVALDDQGRTISAGIQRKPN